MPDPSPQTPNSSEDKSPWNEKLAEILIKAAIGGGAGTLITLFNTSDLPKLALGAGVGSAGMAAYAFVEPIAKRANKGLGQAGDATANAIGKTTGQVIAKLTSAADRYQEAQALACQYCRTEGLAKIEGIFTPMLETVYVPLELDQTGFKPGLAVLSESEAVEPDRSTRADIWQLLSQTQQDLNYRRLVILAWGGYGKTTLLRHLAFTYGRNLQDPALPRLIPILLLLRQYRQELTQDNPLSLPDLITQKHIPDLPLLDGKPLTLPPDWAESILRRGEALVMLDGFDEVPKAQRPLVARWLNQQMRRYSKSTFILTSRPKAYQEQDQATDTLELEMILWVRDFQEEQRQRFVQQWYWCQEYYHHGKEDTPDIRKEAQRSADELLAQIEARAELQALAKNPLLLNMMATFHRRYPSVEMPRRRVELYQEMCLLQLRDRPGARRLESVLGTDESLIILQMLALEMMQQRQERISQEMILQRLTAYLTAQAETVAAPAFLTHIEQVSELLVQREPGEYEFSHLSFQEYLAAREIVRCKQESLLYEQFAEDWWKPTVLLYAAQINPTGLLRVMLSRNATELAYRCCRDTTKRIAADLVTEVQKARYKPLENYLSQEQWREADEETYRLMITTVGKEYGQGFSEVDLEIFPCDDLRTLDQLWVKYSKGHFGFSVQKEIYVETGNPLDGKYHEETFNPFANRVGWKVKDQWQLYSQLDFSCSSPRGILPWEGGVIGYFMFFSSLAQRLANCSTSQS